MSGNKQTLRRRLPVRLLPVTLVAMFVMLSFKVGDVWNDISHIGETVGVLPRNAKAQSVPPAGKPTAAPGEPQAGAQIAAATSELPRDPTRFSQSEIDLLQALAARRDILERREKEIAQREALLSAAEKRLEEKVTELEGVKSELLKMIGRRNEEEDARLRSLVRIYEAMKPKEAAQILEKLDMTVLLGVVERMKESKVAPILASMAPDRAKTVTALLADRKEISPKQ